MRLKFLQSSSASGGAGDAKAAAVLQEEGLSADEVVCRKVAEEHMCFVTLSGWRECVMGLGLFVHPRTVRERRRNLPPEVDLVVDYVSAEAYNLGVRSTVQQHAADEGPAPEPDDEEEAEGGAGSGQPAGERADVLTSSARRRINAWLPLYINEAHWQTAGTFAPSAFSLILTQMNATFQPDDALKVCSRLLCCVVVGFVRSTPDPRQGDRAKASEVAVQMYCDVHRLFHKMAEIYPEIRNKALQEVKEFIESADKRTRNGTPNLGDLVSYLSIIDEFSWADLAPVFVPEMVRRAATRFREPFDASHCGSVEALIDRFDALEPEHGLVILFNKVFNSEVARPTRPWDAVDHMAGEGSPSSGKPQPMPCADVCQMYDRRWGQLTSSKRSALLAEVHRFRGLSSVSGVLRELLPFSFSDDDVVELLLWANDNAANRKAIHTLPNLRRMPRVHFAEWRRPHELRVQMTREVQALLARGLPANESFKLLLQKAAQFEVTLSSSAQPSKHQFASKEEGCEAAALARGGANKAKEDREKQEELYSRSAVGYKGRRIGTKGMGKGKKGDRDRVAKKRADRCSDSSSTSSSESEGKSERLKREVVTEDKSGPAGTTSAEDVGTICAEDTQSFDVSIRHGGSDTPVSETIKVKYTKEDGSRVLVRDFRDMLGAHLRLDPRKMRLVLVGGKMLGVTRPLAHYQVHGKDVVVEVQERHRGGRKPGCGWFKNPPGKLTFQAGVAGQLVRETAFAKVEQYWTRVDAGCRVQALLGLLKVAGKDAVVVCGSARSRAALLQQLRVSESCRVQEENGQIRVRVGSSKLVIVAEVSAPETSDRGSFYIFDRSKQRYDNASIGELPVFAQQEAKGYPQKPGPPTSEQTLQTHVVELPDGISDSGLVVVYEALKESASLARVLEALQRSGQKVRDSIEVVHLVTDSVTTLIETEDERRQVDGILTETGELKEALLLGDQRVPPAALLMQGEATKDAATVLPRVLDFKLRVPAFGYVVRLRQRFGFVVSEVFYGALSTLFEAADLGAGSMLDM